LETAACVARKPSNGPAIGIRAARSASKTCQIVRSACSGCLFALVQPIHWSSSQAFSSEAWCEQPLANIADLVLHLPLLPPRRRRAGDGLDQMMPGTAKPLEFLYAFKEKRRRQTRLYEWQRWVAPKDDQIDRVHSDKKSALKDWFRAHGLTSGYLMGASV
jgi:hypothetical protein